MPDNISLGTVLIKQLLINGSFSISGPTRYKGLPAYWTDKYGYTTGTVDRNDSDSITGGGSMRMLAQRGKRCHLSQTVDTVFPAGTKLTASIWYKNFVGLSSNTTKKLSNTSLKLIFVDREGTCVVREIELLKGTNGVWRRSHITTILDRDIARIEYVIEINNPSNGDYTKEYLFDAAMLEVGDSPTEFEESIFDVPEGLKAEGEFINDRLSVELWRDGTTQITSGPITGELITGAVATKIAVHGISERELFLDPGLLPTRITVENFTGTNVAITNKLYGLWSSPLEESRERGWDVSETSAYRDMIYSYQWPNKVDVDKSYLIGDPGVSKKNIRHLDIASLFDLYDSYTVSSRDLMSTGNRYALNIEAFTIKYDKIWSICREDYTGYSARILKVINPRTEYNSPYLESYADYLVSSGALFRGVATSVGFSTTYENSLYLTLTGSEVASSGQMIRLFRDYYYIDEPSRQIFLRETYTGANEAIVIL